MPKGTNSKTHLEKRGGGSKSRCSIPNVGEECRVNIKVKQMEFQASCKMFRLSLFRSGLSIFINLPSITNRAILFARLTLNIGQTQKPFPHSNRCLLTSCRASGLWLSVRCLLILCLRLTVSPM